MSRTGPRASLWARLWRQGWFKRLFYEVAGLGLAVGSSRETLNCGCAWCDPATAAEPPRPSSHGLLVYHRIATWTDLRARRVVELGCGLGGGARHLTRAFGPRRYLAFDASHALVWGARRRGRPEGVVFRARRSERGPAHPGEADVVLLVEGSHVVVEKETLARSIALELAEGGVCLVVDFFYTRADATHTVEQMRRAMAEAGLSLEREEDWTPGAVAALEADSPARLAAIARLPRFLRKPALAFAGTTQSPLYRQMVEGRAEYRALAWRKPAAGS